MREGGYWRERMKRVIAGSAMSVLVLAACGRGAGTAPTATTLPLLHPASALVVAHPLPALDLEVAGLTRVADLVTPLQLSSTDKGRTITMIGAYADAARTVFLFRESPDMGLPNLRVSDEQGQISAGGSTGPIHSPGFRGDYYVGLDDALNPGADGLAHLTVSIFRLQIWTPAGGIVEGNWVFTPALKVQPAQALPAPSQFRLGAWKVTIEKLELTPSVVYLQTLVNGASPVMVAGPGIGAFVELLDAAGNPVRDLGGGASIAVPKQQVNPVTYMNSRTRDQWVWPAGGSYTLRFLGNGARYEIPIVIGS